MTDPVDPVDPIDPTDPIDPVDPVDPANPQDPVDPVDPKKPFTPEQEQYLGSWFGRIVAKQLDDRLPAKPNDDDYVAPPEGGNAPIDQFNEQLSQGLLGDNPLGAIQKAMNVVEAAKNNQNKTQKIQTDKAITAMSDQPYYKDIYQDMQKIAHEAAGKMEPSMVADYAYTKAKANFMETQANPDNSDLGLLPGGKRVVIKKTGKLPDQFKQAFERDKAKGLFKDEAEYIKHLSPEIKERYGIEG